MPEFASIVWVELHGIQAGQTCFNQILYGRETVVSNPSAQSAAEFFVDVWENTWQDLVVNEFRLLKVVAKINQAPLGANVPAFTVFVDQAGSITDSEPMPVNTVVNVIKIPDNTEKHPDTVEDFLAGRIGFSGLPESAQSNGLLTSGALTSWAAVGEALETLTFDVSGTPTSWQMIMYRGTELGEDITVPVLETAIGQKLGTRNSRKL